MVRKNAVQHGTPQGYDKHMKTPAWGKPCEPCKAAHAQEMSAYRERKERDRTQETRRRTARNRALSRLAEAYPTTYQLLLSEELQEMETSI